MDIDKLKANVIGEIDARYRELGDLSKKLHDNPEIAFEEHQASDWLAEYLEKNGFNVEKGICKLPTAFRGRYGTGQPVIAFLAEYDALPKIGHACGHNLIATSAVAAGMASKRAVDELGGSVMVFGTPGEELYGGKAVMAERGAFTDVDMAMIAHPGGGNTVVMNTLACETLEVEFTGKGAHAAAEPEVGINALEAMIQSYNAINSLRQHIRERARIHGVITDGGEAANIVPAHTAATFMVRAEDDTYLVELKKKVINCFSGAAKATGAKLKYKWGEHYAAMFNNLTMARLFRQNMQSLGRGIRLGGNTMITFSTDVGNVSQLLPTIQPMVAIAPDDVLIHTPQFAKAAASEDGLRGLLDAAKAMAMTVVDLLASTETVEKVQEEFRKGR
ncbi:MAG TPA: M20 family metallopeptidase [Dehalococcoidales bacterium]|nr:M20 family metallopeptidase [Dehalococcoidales bacterium]